MKMVSQTTLQPNNKKSIVCPTHSIQCSPRCSWRFIWCNDFLRCVCWDLMNCEFMIKSIHEYYLSFLWTLLCMIIIAWYFFSDILVCFGQLDWFILPWEGVLCDVFDLAVINLSDRRRHDTHESLLLRVTRWDLFHPWVILSSFLRHYSVLSWT